MKLKKRKVKKKPSISWSWYLKQGVPDTPLNRTYYKDNNLLELLLLLPDEPKEKVEVNTPDLEWLEENQKSIDRSLGLNDEV